MKFWPSKTRYVAVVALLFTAACSNGSLRATEQTPATEASATEAPATEAPAAEAPAGSFPPLATRDGPRSETSGSVPHVQINAVPVPEIDADLRRRTSLIPGVETRESQISLPGAQALWLADDVELARPEVLQVGREFGHFHPDGSLHLWLPVDRANEVAETKWGELHPWVERDNFWDGVVMIYIPETAGEADVALQLVVDAYNYIAGTALDPASFD